MQMIRPTGIIALVALGALLLGSAAAWRLGPQPETRVVPRERVINIPIDILRGTGPSGAQDPATVLVSPGAVDEQPEGPNGFDVLEDGSILLSDPLRNRLAAFDAQGKFRQSWKIGFAADSVTSLANGLVLIREARSGEVHVFDEEGRPRPAEHPSLPSQPEGHLVNGNSGTITKPDVGVSHGGTVSIQLEKPGSTLISLELLATDSTGNAYVALESTTGGKESNAISLNKYVRKYAPDNSLVDEIDDMPLDYYIPPADELRVHKGIVYQLYSTDSEVRINLWNMN
jgi:hypothetical protein